MERKSIVPLQVQFPTHFLEIHCTRHKHLTDPTEVISAKSKRKMQIEKYFLRDIVNYQSHPSPRVLGKFQGSLDCAKY